MDRVGKLADFPSHRIQKAATTLLCDTIHNRNFGLPIARRVLEWTVGIHRVLSDGMYAGKRLHVNDEEHTCRVGCSDEPDGLSLF